MTKRIKLGFIEKKLERRAPFPLVASDKNAYLLDVDSAKYEDACTLYIYAKRADGEVVCDSIELQNGRTEYLLKQGMYIVAGELVLRLVVKNDDGVILTAAEINFDVLPGSVDGTPAEDYETVESFIAELYEMREYITETVGGLNTALDGIIAIQNALLEVSE